MKYPRKQLRKLRQVRLLIAAAGLALLGIAGCKKAESGVQLKGWTADYTTKEIDYRGLIGNGGKTITFSHFIAYESTYKSPQPGGPGGHDEGAQQAFKLLNWLEGQGGAALFPGFARDNSTFPADLRQTRLGQLYKFRGRAGGVSAYLPDGSTAKVDIVVNVVLGASVIGHQLRMDEEFRTELARAMVEDDVVSYNGHVWSYEGRLGASPWEPAPVEPNTLALAAEIERHPVGRNKPGLIYMNACKIEDMEEALMSAMAKAKGGFVEPILLSHRNYSNFDFFADHGAILMIDLMYGKSLPKLMLDLTSTYKRVMGDVDDLSDDDMTAEQAKQKLREYYARPGVKENAQSVIVVAYDLIDGKLKQDKM